MYTNTLKVYLENNFMKFENTVKDFGDEWEKFDNQDLDTIELKKFLNHTFIFFQRKDLIKKNWN